MLDEAIAQLEALKKFRVDIERALCYGRNSHTFNQVCALVIQGQLDVHVLEGAVIIAEVISYPEYKVYHVFIAAGELQPIIEAQRGYLIREAQKRGAKRLSFAGRKGWKKALENEGWSNDLILMSKEVPNGDDVKERNSRHSLVLFMSQNACRERQFFP